MSKRYNWMNHAHELASESKCVSKQVGALLVKNGAIISSGVNGTPSELPNCNEHFSSYNPESDRDAHHAWSLTHELHAEMNLIGKVIRNGVDIEGSTLYVTMQPCSQCCLLLAAVKGITEVVYDVSYDKGDSESLKMLEALDITVSHLPYTAWKEEGTTPADVLKGCLCAIEPSPNGSTHHSILSELDTISWFEFEIFCTHKPTHSGWYEFDINIGTRSQFIDDPITSTVARPTSLEHFIEFRTKDSEALEMMKALGGAGTKIKRSDPLFDPIMEYFKVLSL